MSIDEELAKAIESDQDEALVPNPRRRGDASQKRNVGLLIGLAVVAVAVLALIAFTFKGSAVWANTVEQLVLNKALQGLRVRVEGTLVHGTLMRRDKPCEFRFKLKTKKAVIEVRYPQCVIPDTLQDRPEADVQVTVEGSLGPDGTFVATQVLAKCPSKYEEKDGKRVPLSELERR